MTGQKFKEIAKNGVLVNNPTFRLVLGTCPTLAISSSVFNSLGMGLAVTFILICSNAIISALRKVIPNEVRIPAFILIIATFVTVVRMFLYKYVPALYTSLGVFLPLIVVNCIILGRAESFASKNPVLDSAADGLFTGLGFTLAITLMGLIREILGAGSILGYKLWDFSIDFFGNTAGAFLVYGLMIAGFNALYEKFENNRKRKNYIEEMQASALAIQAKESEPAENADVKEA
ncbi:MAG: electron transport complex subunit E [Clostridiales bacterium]|nr:electron transport complex subunit E [Clostridiales bacterium]